MIKKSRLLALLLVFVLAMSSVAIAVPNENINNDNAGNSTSAFDQNIVARVDAERAIEHIRVLSEEIGTRPGGMESEWELNSMNNSLITNGEFVTGEVVFVEGGLNPLDFNEIDVEGKFVAMTREGSAANYNTQIRNAVNVGAVGAFYIQLLEVEEILVRLLQQHLTHRQ